MSLSRALSLILCAAALLWPHPLAAAPGAAWTDEPDAGVEIGGDSTEDDPMGGEIPLLHPATEGHAALLLRFTGEGDIGGSGGMGGERPLVTPGRVAAEARAVYRSSAIDAAVTSGIRYTVPGDASQVPLTERYTVFGVASPWASAGRLDPPRLYRALADSFTTASDLGRLSPEPPLLLRSDLPSFSSSAAVMNRLALHPFGDTIVLWAGSNEAEEREAALFVRLRPAEAVALEILAAAAAPAVEDFGETEDAWFPDAGELPLRLAGAGMRASLFTRPLRATVTLLASAGPCAEPGTAVSLQLDGSLGPTALRLRAGSADDRFRELRSGPPKRLFAADCRLGVGDDSIVGAEAAASISLARRPLFPLPQDAGRSAPQGPVFAAAVRPGPGRPGRERWQAGLHVGPERLRFSVGGRLETEWNGSGGPLRTERLETALLLQGAEARCRIELIEGRYDATEGRLAVAVERGRFEGRFAATLLCGGGHAAEITPEARAIFQAERFALSLLCEVTRGILLEPPADRQRRMPAGVEGIPLRLTLSVQLE